MFDKRFSRLNLCSLSVAALLFAAPVAASDDDGSDGNRRSRFSAIYSIGDSLTDTGNLAALLGFTDGEVLSPSGASLGVFLKDGRLADGALYINQLAAELASAGDAEASARGGKNYAVAGAVANPDLAVYSPFTLPGTDVLVQARQLAGSKRGSFDSTALTALFVGSNDLFACLAAPLGSIDIGASLTKSVDNIIAAMELLENRGMRRFLVFEAADIGHTPGLQAQVEEGLLPSFALPVARGLTAGFNRRLYTRITELRSQSGFSADVWYFPTFALAEFIATPLGARVTGIADTTPCAPDLGFGQPCESTGFWDVVHLSSAAHRVFADTAKLVLALPPVVRR